ncbi:MAG: CaiB/BaiF CoA-transferase family protein [Crocinitomicaceae bacterium]|nr:CoA transferase [Crocinitomicaceae bacterium]
MKSVLADLTVIEVASVLAGPAVGMYFAEKGAKVIKVENKITNGDVTRSWKLPVEDSNSSISAYFSSVNWHKEHLFLDFNDQNELKELQNLIKNADILITNFKAGDAQKFGLDLHSVKELNDHIILAELSGFGAKDERVAYDLVLQAETGFMSMNGEPNGKVVKMPVAFIDLFAAHQLKEGILEALLTQKLQSGAYHVQVSLYDAAIASLANQASNYLMTGSIPKPLGSKHPNIAPYGELFETKDGFLITFAIGSDKQFESLCKELDIEVKAIYSNNKDRVTHREEIASLISLKVKNFNADDLLNKLIQLKVPVAKVKDLKSVFEDTKAKDLILEETVDNTKTKRVKTVVYSINRI